MAACALDQNWPHRMAPMRYLKYIGPTIAARFAQGPYGINTLQDMIDYVNGHTRAQNEAAWKFIFANNRSRTCVDYTSATPARRYTANGVRGSPWDNPPHITRQGIPLNQRAQLIDGDYLYCVRAYNKCGWESTVHYLRNQPAGDVQLNRIPANQTRQNINDFCGDLQQVQKWCRVPGAARQIRAAPAAPAPRRAAPPQPRRATPELSDDGFDQALAEMEES